MSQRHRNRPSIPGSVLLRNWTRKYSELSIQSKMALQFTVLVGIILSLVFILVFFSFSLYRQVNFENQLRERSIIAAEVFLSEDNVTKDKFHEIQNKYQKALSDELISVYDKNNVSVFTVNKALKFKEELINKIRGLSELYFRFGDRECYGIYYHDNQGDYVIISSAIDKKGYDLIRFLWVIMASIFIISLVGVYFLGGLFARNALSPISNVIKQVSKIGASNLYLRVREGKRKDEIGELARTFNNMISRLEESFEIQKSFVSGASHEFRTPITSLIGEIEVGLSKSRDVKGYIEILEKILIQAEKLNEITESLLNLTKAGDEFTKNEPVRLDQLVFDAIDSLPHKLHPDRIDLTMNNLPDDPSDLIVRANKNLLIMALGNILSNALKFSKDKKVQCTLSQTETQTSIIIEDYGIGIKEEDLKRIFQPFYRADNAHGFEGTGIGLSLSDKIIKMYKGQLLVNSEINQGTVFKVIFSR